MGLSENSLKIVKTNYNTIRIVKNKEGNLLSKQLFNTNNDLLETYDYDKKKHEIYVYGSTGRLLCIKNKYKDLPNTVQYFKYDEFGNKIFSTYSKKEYKMKLYKKKISNNTFRYEIKDVFVGEVQYDSKNRIVVFSNLTPTFKKKYRQLTDYNEKGLPVRLSDSNGLTETFEYDERGNCTKFIRELRDQKYSETYTYDGDNKATYCKTSSGREEFVHYENTRYNHLILEEE